MADFAAPYARAFAQVVAASNLDTAAVQQQLQDFSATFDDSSQLRELMANPAVQHPQKLKVLDAIAAKIGMCPQVRNFLAVLMDHHRLESLNTVIEAYHALADQQQGIVSGTVTTARALNEEDRVALEEKIAHMASSRVRLTYTEDAALMGGLIVRIGSTVYDGSVRGQLDALRQELAGA